MRTTRTLRLRWWPWGPSLLAGLVPLAVLAAFFVYPVVRIVDRGLRPEGRLDLGVVGETLSRPRTQDAILFTLGSAAAATVIALVAGVLVAAAVSRLEFGGRRLVSAVVAIPFVLPTVVVGVAFRRLLAESGPLGFLGLDGTPAGIVIALAFFNIGVVARTVGARWSALDPRPAEAAAGLGARPWQVFTGVTWPALRGSVVAAGSVVFLFCATSFGVVLTMGGLRYANVETEIYLLTTQELDLGSAAVLSLIQLSAIVVGLALLGRFRAARGGRVQRGERRPARGWDRLLVLGSFVVAAGVAIPVVVLGLASVRTAEGAWSLAGYRALVEVAPGLPSSGLQALGQSALVALQATALAVPLGLIVAVLVSRRTASPPLRRLQGLFDGLFMLPLGISAVTVGFGFLIALDRPPLDLRSSSLLVPIAQAVVALPLVVRTLVPVLAGIDPRQREAAAGLGAGPGRVLWQIELRAVLPAVGVAAGFAAAVSLGEFGATSFLARADSPTLPVLIYQVIGRPGPENLQIATAGSVLLAAVTALVFLAADRRRQPDHHSDRQEFR